MKTFPISSSTATCSGPPAPRPTTFQLPPHHAHPAHPALHSLIPVTILQVNNPENEAALWVMVKNLRCQENSITKIRGKASVHRATQHMGSFTSRPTSLPLQYFVVHNGQKKWIWWVKIDNWTADRNPNLLFWSTHEDSCDLANGGARASRTVGCLLSSN
jgi:hypothetical protein